MPGGEHGTHDEQPKPKMIASKTAPSTIERISTKRPRSTWSSKNANQFRQIFDILINTGQPQIILYESVSVTPNTLQVKIYDALGWLAENDPSSTYRELKKISTIRQERDGITIRLKEGIISSENIVKKQKWQDELVQFLSEAREGEVREFSEVRLLSEDEEILAGICAGVGTYKIFGDKLIVIKGI
jgi:hypothetical protein